MHEAVEHPADHRPELDSLTDHESLARPDGVPVVGTSTVHGSITLVAGTLVLAGDVGTDLCLAFRATAPTLDGVQCLDARQVTFLGSPGVGLLAQVAHDRGAGVPLWGSRAALRPLRLTGLDRLFDVRPA
ncbi:hypothetical protein [Klenkia brasiliensis]|uniref:Anti-anti-sigma regulatory factor (Antagonist of anti-sigma factor) n=1 Tax=Klenkia brasiliensis TaxID=333142 RepID=A0A1G7ZE30_9ACTN|nr:hypothetical protein [Klenkia brasiliensis]SDH06875.1 Anti-anti-sigma regulatory factor (antagonist of anti-sigma factor) [Klenkia brasiliensis]